MIKIQTIFIISVLIVLTGCGPSKEEKQEIALITCNFMSETRNMDSAIRVKEMNNAREKIGEDRFLGRDNDIKESIQYGLCEELVLNDPDYKNKISKNKSIYERERRLKYEENKRFEERQKKKQKKD